MILMFLHHPYSLYIQAFLSLLVQVLGGPKFYKGAIAGLKTRTGNMDLLISIGTTSALIYSFLALFKVIPGEPFFETNAFLISFVRLGKFIEERTKTRALSLLKELFALQSSRVKVWTSSGEIEINVSDLFPGDIIVVKTGDLVPVDGKIVEGLVEVDESLISGESVPILKKKGDNLISGSIIVNGYAKVEVTSQVESSYVGVLIRLIEEALQRKPKIQRLADRVSHYFVQIILLLSVAVFLIWFIKTQELSLSFNFALALLVISCPCAFGLAVPLAIFVGLTRTYKKGILVKDPGSFERAGHIDILILDKTGTITVGKPKVTEFKSLDDKAIEIAFSLALTSQHPYSKAIVEYAKHLNLSPIQLGECREVPGVGIFCGDYFLGRNPSGKGLILREREQILAEIEVEDEIRVEAKEVLENIRKRGLGIILATGDTRERAATVAEKLGIETIYAEIKPQDKLRLIEDFQKRGLKVAIVGDGVNDAPAMARADLSFVMAEGVDIAKRVGDVILLSGLRGIVYFFDIADKTRKRIWQNLFWAFIYNILSIPIAGGILYHKGIVLKPEFAGLMMALSSASVVINSIRR